MSYKSELGDFEIRKKYKKGDFLANDKYIVTYDYTVGNGYAMQGGLYGVCGVRKDEPDKFIVGKFFGSENSFSRLANDTEFNILADTITSNGYEWNKENEKLIKVNDVDVRDAAYFRKLADNAVEKKNNGDGIDKYLITLEHTIEILAFDGKYECSFLFTDRHENIYTIIEYFVNRKFKVKATLMSYDKKRSDYWVRISWKEERVTKRLPFLLLYELLDIESVLYIVVAHYLSSVVDINKCIDCIPISTSLT